MKGATGILIGIIALSVGLAFAVAWVWFLGWGITVIAAELFNKDISLFVGILIAVVASAIFGGSQT